MSKRILDLTTISSVSNDDYLVVDGSSGTRKITLENIVGNSTVAQTLAEHISDASDDIEEMRSAIGSLQGAVENIPIVDATPTANSTNAIQSGAVKEIADRVAELEADTVYTMIGNTPVTLEADTEVRLSASHQTEYTLSGIFLADYNSNDEEAEVRLTNTSLTKENGKMIFTATGENINQCFADLRLNNLTVGETYTLTITRGEYVSGTTGGYFIVYDREGNELARPGDITQDVVTVDFVATTTFARVRLQPTTNYYYETYGITTATIVNAVVTKQRAGTFSTTTDLGNLAAGVTISASPACSVYSITRESDIDEALSAVSRNPVQNRAIAAAIGPLSDLATSAKGNLVAAINEAASSSGSRLTGKRCVFLGDSVSAFQAPPGDIPSIVGAATGMTVVNGCFGGCRITDTVTDDYGSFSFVKLVDAIVSGDWTQQDTDVATLDNLEDEYSPTDHLTALKAVNWNNVDILVVHWAGNDPGNVRIDDPTNDENTSYYLGALRYCIRKLWTNFPQLKILYANCTYHEWPSLNTNTDDREYTIDGQTYHYYDWGDAVLEEAKKLKFPTLDLYRTSCIGPQNVAYWMSSDLTHPKPRGNQLIAGKIAAKLLSEF